MLEIESISFNKPFLSNSVNEYINKVLISNKHSGNGIFTKYVNNFFNKKYNVNKSLLTTSCTDALEMTSLLIDIKPGDEVILPSYTFVSTANAFALRGAKLTFCDSEPNFPNIDANKIEELISKRTKAIVVVHYAGFACNMEKIMSIAKEKKLFVIEDAAQAIDNYYINEKGIKLPLGTIGDLGTLSFHETKNISCGEGGLLLINNSKFNEKADVALEKGTNRTSFFEGKVNKYEWVGLGSSFLPSEFTAAILYSQLKNKNKIKRRRIKIWNRYQNNLKSIINNKDLMTVDYPAYSTNNAHIYFLLTKNIEERESLIKFLKQYNISTATHYLSLNKSPFYLESNELFTLENSDRFTDTLLRLPIFYDLKIKEVDYICSLIIDFYKNAL